MRLHRSLFPFFFPFFSPRSLPPISDISKTVRETPFPPDIFGVFFLNRSSFVDELLLTCPWTKRHFLSLAFGPWVPLGRPERDFGTCLSPARGEVKLFLNGDLFFGGGVFSPPFKVPFDPPSGSAHRDQRKETFHSFDEPPVEKLFFLNTAPYR